MMCSERYLLDFIQVDADLMIPRAQIKLGEEVRAMEFIEQLLDDGYRELVLHRLLIQGVVIHAQAPRSIMFLHQEHGRRERQLTRANDALLEHGRALGLQLILLKLRIPVQPYCHQC